MKKILFILLLGLVTLLDAKIISDREFTDRYILTLNKLDATVTVKEAGWFRLVLSKDGEEGEVVTYLDNAYQTYKDNESDLDLVLQRYAQNALNGLKLPDEKELKKENIVPVIKDKGYLKSMRELREGNLTDAYEIYNDDLVIFYAEDTPERLAYLKKEDLDKLGLNYSDTRKLALKNLNRIVGRQLSVEAYEESVILHADGMFETSLILAEEIWKERMIKVQGDYIVIIPARGLLLVTGSKSKKGIQVLRNIVKGAEIEAAYPVSTKLFRFDGSKFVVFE